MARTRGRVIISKIDSNGKRIKGSLAAWIKAHPGELYFDSAPEWEVWDYLKTAKLNHEMKTELLLFDKMSTPEFYPADKKKGKPACIKDYKQQPIRYTPDYYLPDYDLYIEVKGYEDELFKMRWKLFKLNGYKGLVVYSLEDFIAVIKLLKQIYPTTITV
jgi:hypothetical protein